MNAQNIITTLDVASLLLHKERQDLLELLHEPKSASALARETGRPRQQINYHLRELEKRGYLKHVEDRLRGNCVERVLVRTVDSISISPEVLGKLFAKPEQQPDKLSASYLIAVAGKVIRDLGRMLVLASTQKKKLATFALTSEIRFASAEQRAQFAAEVTDALAKIAAKYHDETAPQGRSFTWLFGAYPTLNEPATGDQHER